MSNAQISSHCLLELANLKDVVLLTEARLVHRAGLPSVILPQWADHYRYAQTAEYLGVGIWPSKETSPGWEAAALTEAFLKVLGGETSVAMREKAKALSEKGLRYGGDKAAAALIAKLAVEGR